MLSVAGPFFGFLEQCRRLGAVQRTARGRWILSGRSGVDHLQATIKKNREDEEGRRWFCESNSVGRAGTTLYVGNNQKAAK